MHQRLTTPIRHWKKLVDAASAYEPWVMVITGQMGEALDSGFKLENAKGQVFERKAKVEAVEPAPVAPEPLPAPAPAPAPEAAPAPEPVTVRRRRRLLPRPHPCHRGPNWA